ncbi:MAG: hypothetical protein ACK4SQ_08025, partial [Allorhizobium sp.]
AHVSLSSIFNCQKTDGPNTRQKSLNPTRKPGNKSAIQPISRSCLNQSSRPSGAALSFGEAAYTANPSNRQQPFVKKLSFFSSY